MIRDALIRTIVEMSSKMIHISEKSEGRRIRSQNVFDADRDDCEGDDHQRPRNLGRRAWPRTYEQLGYVDPRGFN